MRLVINGIADFYEAEPEDLVIIVENLEEHFMVTHELRIWNTGKLGWNITKKF